MSAIILDGKALSGRIKEKLAGEVRQLKEKGIHPGLAVVLAGEDAASKIYVGNKIKACEETGIKSFAYRLPEDVTESALTELVDALAADQNVHGILVQLPLPRHLNEKNVLSHIPAHKDADGFLAENAGHLMLGNSEAVPACTPAGCMELIKEAGISLSGKQAVVVGRSNIVGKPLALLLLQQNATVTVCHSRTEDLKAHTLRADVLCAAVGKAKMITADMVKPGAVVIDVGMNRDQNGKLCGDVDFAAVKEVAGYITPVPGGVGPMTIAMLMVNTVKAAKAQCLT